MSYHILVVGNEPGHQEVARRALECDGFHITFTPGNGAAISLLISLQIDLVIVKANLPDGLGTRVVRNAASLKIPAIVMGGGEARHMRELDAESIGCVAGPLRLEQLREQVRDRLIKADRS